MAVIIDLGRRINAGAKGYIARKAVAPRNPEGNVLLRPKAVHAEDIEDLITPEAQGLDGVGISELERQHSHTDEIRAVDALEAPGDDGADTQQKRAFCGPVP